MGAFGPMPIDSGRWDHNIHYHPVLLDAVPAAADRGLDVGCGDGALARQLHRRVRHVAAIDVHEPSIELARRQDAGGDIDYLLGDFLTWDFEPASFDVVVSVAALHHMNATAALDRMRRLLRPGGVLAILGLARSHHPADLPRDVAATLVSWAHRLSHARRLSTDPWQSPAPTVWPPPHTHREIQLLAERALPQVRFRRHLLWRYSLTWTRPG